MPNLKSSKKRLRRNAKARMRNKSIRSRMRTAIKKVRQAPDRTEAEAALKQAVSIIDKTAQKRIIHRNTAARYKSRLDRMVKGMA